MKRVKVDFLVLGVVLVAGLGIFMAGCSTFDPTPPPAPANTTSTSATSTSSSTTSTLPSISGKVLFATTSDGIKGGVFVQAQGPVTLTTSADSASGAFSFDNPPAGTYTLTATKDAWIINSRIAVFSSSSLANQDLIATPENWTILHVGGGDSLKYLASLGDGTKIIALGSILYSSNSGEAWTALTAPTSDALMESDTMGPTNIMLFTGKGWLYISTDEGTDAFLGVVDLGPPPTPPHTPLYMPLVNIDAKATRSKSNLFINRTDGKLITYPDMFNSSITYSVITTPHSSYNNLEVNPDVADEVYLVGNGGVFDKGSINSLPLTQVGTPATFEAQDLNGVGLWGATWLVTATAADSSGSIFSSFDSGETWTKELSGVPYALNFPTSNSNSGGAIWYVSGDNGLIMKRVY